MTGYPQHCDSVLHTVINIKSYADQPDAAQARQHVSDTRSTDNPVLCLMYPAYQCLQLMVRQHQLFNNNNNKKQGPKH